MNRIDLKNFDIEELETFLSGLGKERFRARQIFKWMYQRGVEDFGEMSNLSRDFRGELEEKAYVSRIDPAAEEVSSDGTRKYLFVLEDGNSVESVLIPDEERATLCISSQVGCAMGCRFCLTGTFNLTRNLTTAEIVNQVCAVKRLAPEHPPVRNIVFMGMGEPLANLDNVARAIRILIHDDALQFSNRRVTVSTSGLVPEMDELGKRVTVNLAVSLNATTDEVRSAIMPVNRAYPLAELMAACRRFPLPSRRMITFEYVLIRGVNDTREDARRLVRLLHGIPSKVNLIPYNEHAAADFRAPLRETIDYFHRYLLDRHITVITRESRGADISAACGQLKGKLEKTCADDAAREEEKDV
ncbi:MAG TPA: 23S rRNA (adenine(2503)-C(2))-methyltransferase RlmN [Verrucomicrobiae bacterium]|nr:23S rRNA (adenine(2503)-C(2))-methyltransferase RlmN [Verrucomicrobiae bacterium]